MERRIREQHRERKQDEEDKNEEFDKIHVDSCYIDRHREDGMRTTDKFDYTQVRFYRGSARCMK